MKVFLGAEKTLIMVIETEECPDDGDTMESSSWKKRIPKAAAMINSACHTSVKHNIRHITDTSEICKELGEKLDRTPSRTGGCGLLRQFHVLQPITSSKSPFGVTEYISAHLWSTAIGWKG